MRKLGGKKGGPGKLFLGLCTRWQLGDVGVSIPPWSALRGGSGQIAMEGKMMRKTIEKMREYDIKQWEKNGKGGENDEKNNGKKEGL